MDVVFSAQCDVVTIMLPKFARNLLLGTYKLTSLLAVASWDIGPDIEA